MGVEETMVKNDPKVPTWMTWWEKCHFLGLVREQEKPTGWGREEGIGVGEGRLGEGRISLSPESPSYLQVL